MNRPIRWLAAAALSALALFATERVYSLSCEPDEYETLHLEIRSVTRGGEEVEDLSPWKSIHNSEVETVLEAERNERATFYMESTSSVKHLELGLEQAEGSGGSQ